MQEKDAAAIASAAAVAAPAQAAKIVAEVCAAAPARFAAVAKAVSQVAPKADKEILAALLQSLPALKPFVERVSAEGMSLAAILSQAESLLITTADAGKTSVAKILSGAATGPLAPPSSGPAFTSPGTTTSIDRTGTPQIAPGSGRAYSGG